MTFAISGAAYDRFMGRYSAELAPVFADFVGVGAGARALDVGCGTGVLTAELVRRLGAANVAAADPQPGLLEACRQKLPGVDVRQAPGEALPWSDGQFDVAASQLVVSFMTDATAGLREMRRVVRPGGRVAACMWEAGEAMQMVHLFWQSAAAVDPVGAPSEPRMPYRTEAELGALFRGAGLEPELARLPVSVTYESFEDFWQPLRAAAGPVGAHMGRLDEAQRSALRDECFRRLDQPSGSFSLNARVVAARAMI